MVSAITERPYTFLRWLTGTLPGRKPLRRTLRLRSTRRASALASRSDAGTLIWNSCFNPSVRVSVTCMASIFFSAGPHLDGADIVNLVDARQKACAGGSDDPNRSSSNPHANAVSAWCGRRDSNPHDFRHWNLNPARLPIPPRPRPSRAGFKANPPEGGPYSRGFGGLLGVPSRGGKATLSGLVRQSDRRLAEGVFPSRWGADIGVAEPEL